MLQVLQKKIQNTQLTFTNQRAIFWEAEKTLILSDLHVGKSAHFRKHGIPVSSEILTDDLKNLEDLIHHFQPEKVMIVGDLFHAGYNSDLELFKDWRQQFNQNFTLIRGNHDKLKCEIYENLGIDCEDDFVENIPFTFIHHPKKIEENKFYISGHIHPGFVLRTRNESLKLPCFGVSSHQIVLPAFSKFTGLDTKSLQGNFSNIVFTEGTIFEV